MLLALSGAAGCSAHTFVAAHGALHVSGSQVVDASAQPVQLRGMSLFWSQWSRYYTASTVDQLADEWHSSLVRAALGVEQGGYLENPAENEAKVVAVVDRAIARGIYVIIDWHDHHALDHQPAAVEFFTRMAVKYGSTPNVIFEIFNEPLAESWQSIKAYAQPVITAIRNAGGKNLIVVGTPNWSQDVDIAAESQIAGATDVAYALHFYAATHQQLMRDKAIKALAAGLPLFVTEWGACEATGNGVLDQPETKAWIELLARHHISWANWALNDKDEACSALKPGTPVNEQWTESTLSSSGALVKPLIR